MSDDPTKSIYCDDQDFISVFPTFYKNLSKSLSALETSLEKKQIKDILKLLHRSKGSAQVFGFVTLGAESEKLEKLVSDKSNLEELDQDFSDYFKLIQAILKAN